MRETQRASRAWEDYLALGPGRSLEKLATVYRESTVDVPTTSLATLKRWSEALAWQARIAGEIAREREEREATIRREQREAFDTGLGSALDRVKLLKALGVRQARIIDRLLTKILDEEEHTDAKRWVFVNRRYEVMFNSLAQTLKDLAEETGGRRKQVDLNVMRWEVAQEVAKITGKDADAVLRRMSEVA